MSVNSVCRVYISVSGVCVGVRVRVFIVCVRECVNESLSVREFLNECECLQCVST